jgi:hypothetical protein
VANPECFFCWRAVPLRGRQPTECPSPRLPGPALPLSSSLCQRTSGKRGLVSPAPLPWWRWRGAVLSSRGLLGFSHFPRLARSVALSVRCWPCLAGSPTGCAGHGRWASSDREILHARPEGSAGTTVDAVRLAIDMPRGPDSLPPTPSGASRVPHAPLVDDDLMLLRRWPCSSRAKLLHGGHGRLLARGAAPDGPAGARHRPVSLTWMPGRQR